MGPRHLARLITTITLAGAGAGAAGCAETGGSGPPQVTAAGSARSDATTTAVIDPGDGGDYQPVIDPANFVATVDNPYLPLRAGSRWVYEGTSDGERERVEVVVTADRREVMGIAATVVRDTVHVDGQLVEDTLDWYAQDRDGNVWYLGEQVANYDHGELVDAAGSWEAGVDGALPGIAMPADPAVGAAYRQEYWVGAAEDMGEVIATGGHRAVAAGEFDGVVTTRDWTPLEADVIEEKQYAPGVGQIRETTVAGGTGVTELVEFTPGG